MTKEELEKEAVEYAEKINLQNVNISGVVRNHISQSYLASAEPREKQIAELEKENAELKADNDARKFAMAMSEKVEKQLREENSKQTIQLTNAKELLAKWVELFKPKVGNIPPTPIQVDTEHFLNSEVEK